MPDQYRGPAGTGIDELNMDKTLYHYFRSSCSWRVRWALLLKGVTDVDWVAVDLLAGQQKAPEYKAKNPAGHVPMLEVAGVPLSESLAILEYLEEVYPDPPLLPRDPLLRARTRQLALVIAAGTQPLQNLSTLRKVSDDDDKRKEWARHFIFEGLATYEGLLQQELPPQMQPGRYSLGDRLTLADLCLIPQCRNARRYDLDVTEDRFPTIARIEKNCLQTVEAQKSSPEQVGK